MGKIPYTKEKSQSFTWGPQYYFKNYNKQNFFSKKYYRYHINDILVIFFSRATGQIVTKQITK